MTDMLKLDLFGPPSDPPLSEHIRLEIAAARERGRPLQPGEPVPGCPCRKCTWGPPPLYPFQGRAIERLRENIRAGVRNQVLSAPTGSGKTVISAHLLMDVLERGTRSVFVTDRLSLLDQTSRMLDCYGIPHGVIQADHWRRTPWRRIQIASAQTLGRRRWPDDIELIVVDECHSFYKPVLDRIAKRDCWVVGLTATPLTRGMGRHYDRVVSVTTTHELIAQGYLAPYRIFAASEPDMTGVKLTKRGEWSDREAAQRVMPIVGDCVSEYLKHADGRKFIAFGVTVAHCEELQRQFLAAGIPTGLYTHRTGAGERNSLVEEFRGSSSYLRGLISVAALAKGFDAEDVGCIIIARPFRRSLAEHIQMLGRGLRRDPADPSKQCIVLDHAGNCVRFWHEMNAFFDEGARYLDDGKPRRKKRNNSQGKPPRKCPACAHVHPSLPSCPMCGHEYPRRSGIDHKAGELAELGSRSRTVWDDRATVYRQLLWMANDRGYQRGWVSHMYKRRYGIWPKHGSTEPEPPSGDLVRWVQSWQIARAKSRTVA